MVSLLVLSLALSTPAAATQAAAVQNGPASTPPPELFLEPGTPLTIEEGPADTSVTHPDSGTCYRIRAFLFTPGRNPRFLRETTCGPKKVTSAPARFRPLDLKIKPASKGEQDVPMQ